MDLRLSLGVASMLVLLACGDSSATSSDDPQGGSPGDGGSTSNNPTTGGSPPTGEPANLIGITEAHNIVRANVNPAPGTPMPPLVWDPAVAAVAQAYSDLCVFEHSGGDYGENLFASTNASNALDVVTSWASEVSFYDYGSNSCSDVCGHYTQIVWAESLRLGCGVTDCTTGSPFGSGSWQNWVCNYDPPGNFIGEQPY